MANHVYFHISEPEAEVIDKLVRTWERTVTTNWSGEPIEPYTVTEIVELEEQPFMPNDCTDDTMYDWYMNNVGAKWCHLEDHDFSTLSGYSAWSPPTEMFEHLSVAISNKCGHSVFTRMTYEDEFRNFVGVATCETEMLDGEWIAALDYEEIEGEDINIRFKEEYPDIDIDAEDFDWHGEYETEDGSVYPNEVCDDYVYNFFDRGEW
jgi:hypothetical protein